jgi:hypothetical protein
MVIGNLVPLDAELKEQFQQLFRAVKRNTIAIAKQAFQIHSEHYLRTERKYDKDFEVWWEAQGLEQVFGSRGNWTKWYRAGEALEKFKPNLRNTPINFRQLVMRFMKSPCYSLTNCVCVWKIITAEVHSLNPKPNGSARKGYNL